MPRLGRIAGLLFATLVTGWGCGGATISFPSDGGGASSSSSSGGVINPGSSSGSGSSSSGGVGSSTGSGSSSGVVSSSTSSGSGSGSGSSSGFSGSSSGDGSSSSSGGPPTCSAPCHSDSQCQATCPPVAGGSNCCDPASNVCYATTQSSCPGPVMDAGCPTGGPICSPNGQGNTPPNPNTGSTGCDDCIECSCGMSWCACAGDSSLDGSGNPTGCLGYVDCFIACIGGDPDAGVPPGTAQQCGQQCAPAYPMKQVQEGDAFIQCVAGSCSTSTTCGG